MVLEAILAGIVGGVLSLDRFQICQVMISRPLVSASILGWVLGDPSSGIAAGILFELLWLRTPPVGGYVPPDGTFAAVATAAVSAIVRESSGVPVKTVVCLAFLLLFPLALLGTLLDVRLRTMLGNLAGKAENALTERSNGPMYPYFLAASALGFFSTFSILFPIVLGGALVVTAIIPLLSPQIQASMGIAFYVAPLMGIADLMVRLDEKQDIAFFFIGLAAAFGIALCFM